MQLILATVLVFVSAAIVPSEAITCYNCTYNSLLGDTACSQPASDAVGLCTGESCMKVVVTAGAIEVVQRNCSSDATNTGCTTGTYASIEYAVCKCTTDRCNGASFYSYTITSMVALLLSAFGAASRF